MAAPPTPDPTALLPWAWSLEHLSDNPSAPLPLLYGTNLLPPSSSLLPFFFSSFSPSSSWFLCTCAGWFKKVPENSGVEESFENGRERFALRCLHDVLDSGFDGEANAPRPMEELGLTSIGMVLPRMWFVRWILRLPFPSSGRWEVWIISSWMNLRVGEVGFGRWWKLSCLWATGGCLLFFFFESSIGVQAWKISC